MDDEGLDLDALETELRRGGEISFLYTIPTFQNPSGRTLGAERRRGSSSSRPSTTSPILEDDPYGRVRYEGEAPPSLHELDGGDARDVHVVVLEDRGAGAARRLLRRRRGTAREFRRPRRLDVHLAPAAAAGDRLRAHDRGGFEPNLERVRGLAPRAPSAHARARSSAKCPPA